MGRFGCIITSASRFLLAGVFIFSGITKVVDPWGTAIKIGEYLSVYGLDALSGVAMPLSIALCAIELLLGLMLLLKLLPRVVSAVTLITVVVFTIVTLLSATILPVEDCGCFGDAVKLTAMQTLYKNLALIPLAVILWRKWSKYSFRPTLGHSLATLALASMCFGVGIYCNSHLPLIDFLPFKVGTNLKDQVLSPSEEPSSEVKTTLIYREIATGKLHEFTLEDTQWHDENKWEWVETKIDQETPINISALSEFALRNNSGDATEQILTTSGELTLVCITDLNQIPTQCLESIISLIHNKQAQGKEIVCITPSQISHDDYHSFGQSAQVPIFNVDGTLLKTMLRAKNGTITLHDGVIVSKLNCRDIE